jgi:uracil-DNA glycosylase family 4
VAEPKSFLLKGLPAPKAKDTPAKAKARREPFNFPRRLLISYDPRAHGANCDACPLNGRPVIPPTKANIATPDGILVGQEPGFEEERLGEVFVGASGRKVNAVMKKQGLDRSRFHITNAALCRYQKPKDQVKAMACCAPRLQRELDSFPKSVPVIPMGSFALRSSYGKKVPITLGRGFIWQKDGRTFLPTVHPAYVLRDGLQTPLFNRDFRRVGELIRGTLKIEAPTNYTVARSLKDLTKTLKKFANVVAADIETSEDPPTLATLTCIGISDGVNTTVVPWLVEYKDALNLFFKNRTAVFHNGYAFDEIVLNRYGVKLGKTEDTLIAHHVFASHFPQRLDHLVSVYCDSEPWKIQFGKRVSDEKGRAKVPQDLETLYKYNALDAYLTFLVWMRMQKDLKPWTSLYEEDKDLAEFCQHMQKSGVQVDVALKEQLSKEIVEKEARLLNEMFKLVGHEFSPTKLTDIRKILFEEFKAPIQKRTDTGLPAVDKEVLRGFGALKERPYGAFCLKLVEWRSAGKMRSTYLDNILIEPDGRVHPSWRSFGTVTGRLAVRRPNLQNLKRMDKKYKDQPEQKIRMIYIPRKGCKFVGFDLSQVEMRTAAFLSGDPVFTANVVSGDMHTANAKLLFGEIPALMDSKRAKEGDGKRMRDISKNAGFAVNYMAVAETVYKTLQSQGFTEVKYTKVCDMLKRLQAAYKVYYKFVESNVESTRKSGNLKVGWLTGRIRWIGHAPAPSDCANGPNQGTAADIMNRACIRIRKRFKATWGNDLVRLVAQVHDSCIAEVPDRLVDEVKAIIVEEMSKKIMVGGEYRDFPIDLKEGVRWSEV